MSVCNNETQKKYINKKEYFVWIENFEEKKTKKTNLKL